MFEFKVDYENSIKPLAVTLLVMLVLGMLYSMNVQIEKNKQQSHVIRKEVP